MGAPGPTLLGFALDERAYHLFVAVVLGAALWVARNLSQSHFGRGFLALKGSETASRALGLNATKLKLIAFGVCAFYTGLSGALYAPVVRFIDPSLFNIMVSISFVSMVIVGRAGLDHGFGAGGGVRHWRAAAAHLLRLRPVPARAVRRGDDPGADVPARRAGQPAQAQEAAGRGHREHRLRHGGAAMRALVDGTPVATRAQPSPGTAPLLRLSDVRMSFGGIVAVQDVGFDVMPGTVHALIGPNGAGKTTMLNCISRFYTPQKGAMRLRTPTGEHDLLKCKAHQISRLGIARTFQNLELFSELTVFDNVLIARSGAMRCTLAEALLRLPRQRREEREQRERTQQIIDSLALGAHAHTLVRDLPYGTQKLVELARAMALEPVLMLLDEPAAGMNNREIDALGDTLRRLQQATGATLLLIEHSMPLVMSISDTITVMHNGAFLAQGSPREIEQNPAVVEAYLGGGKSGQTPLNPTSAASPCCAWTTWAPPTARSARCTACRSRCRPRASCACWAPTARARPR
jgi:branched-chain amino acid transport system ATP-binding protein